MFKLLKWLFILGVLTGAFFFFHLKWNTSTATTCKLSLAVPDLTQASIDRVHKALESSLQASSVTGWTLYPVHGAWRSKPQDKFQRESSMVIEIVGQSYLTGLSFDLAFTLEKMFEKEKVLVTCFEVTTN